MAGAVEYYHLLGYTIHPPESPIQLCWTPPNMQYYKLKTGGAYTGNTGKGGIGGVIRNSKSEWVISFL